MSNSPKMVVPQQIRAATPPIIGSAIVGGWDRNEWRTLNLDALRQLWRLFERIQPIGKIDARHAISATVPATAEVDDVVTSSITVPSGELWFIQKLVLQSPEQTAAEGQIVLVNFRISSFPDDADPPSEDGKLYWATGKGTIAADVFPVEFFTGAPGLDYGGGALDEEGVRNDNLDVPLRLVGGDKITLVATLTAVNATAGLVSTLTPYGYKGRILGA